MKEDDYFYCCSASKNDCPEKGNCLESGCPDYHWKHPTPEQFKREFGFDVPGNMPVWVLIAFDEWILTTYNSEYFPATDGELGKVRYDRTRYYCPDRIRRVIAVVVCCTPFGKPDHEWRPI